MKSQIKQAIRQYVPQLDTESFEAEIELIPTQIDRIKTHILHSISKFNLICCCLWQYC